MFKTTVFTFGVFSESDDIDVLIRGFDSLDAFAWSEIDVKVELLSQSDVERSVTLSNRGFEWTCKSE